MVQALKAGELDYAHGVNADQFDAAQDRPEHRDRGRQRQRLDRARLQQLRHRHRQDDPERRTVDQGPARPGVPRRPRLRHRQARRSSSGSSAATATSARRTSRRSSTQWHVEPDHAADVRHRAGQAEARRRRLLARRERAAARQGRQADQPAAGHARLGRRTTRRPRSSSRTGTASSGSRSRPRSFELGGPRRRSCCRPRPATSTPPTTTSCIWGWGGGVDPNGLLDLHAATRSAHRPTATTATPPTTSCTRPAERRPATRRARPSSTEMQKIIYDKAAVPHPVLRRRPRRLPDRPVRGLAEPAAENGTPLFTYSTLAATRC